MKVVFAVPGEPVGKARPRLGRGGRVYTPAKTTKFENRVGFYFLAPARECQWPEPDAITEPLEILVWSVFPLPKSLSKKKRAARAGSPHTHTPDADNLLKAVCDGLNGVAFGDDKVIARATVSKRWAQEGEEAKTIVRLQSWEE